MAEAITLRFPIRRYSAGWLLISVVALFSPWLYSGLYTGLFTFYLGLLLAASALTLIFATICDTAKKVIITDSTVSVKRFSGIMTESAQNIERVTLHLLPTPACDILFSTGARIEFTAAFDNFEKAIRYFVSLGLLSSAEFSAFQNRRVGVNRATLILTVVLLVLFLDKAKGFAESAFVDFAFAHKVRPIRVLVDSGMSPNFATSKEKLTPLVAAILSKDYPIAEYLLRHGANINAELADGSTALILAASKGDKVSLNFLLRNGADVSRRRADGKNAIDVANDGHHDDLVFLLRSKQ